MPKIENKNSLLFTIKKSWNDLFQAGKSVVGSLTDGNFWYSISMFSQTSYGINVSDFIDKGYKTNPFVYMVVNKISSVASRLPIDLVDEKGKPTMDMTLDWFYRYPNCEQSLQEFLENIFIELNVTGNAFIHFEKPEGFTQPKEAEVLLTRFVSIMCNANGDIVTYDYIENGIQYHYFPEEICHIKFANITHSNQQDRHWGLSPLLAGSRVFHSSNSIFDAEDKLYKNVGTSIILTNDSDQVMLPNDKQNLQDQFDKENNGTANFGKVKISTAKLRKIDLMRTPREMSFGETSLEKLRIICALYGVDSSIFNDPANKTYSNRTEATRGFYQEVIIPLATYVLDEINKYLFQDLYKSKNKLKIDVNKIDSVKEVNKTLSDKVTNEVKSGILSAQQALAILYPDLVYDPKAKPETVNINSGNENTQTQP